MSDIAKGHNHHVNDYCLEGHCPGWKRYVPRPTVESLTAEVERLRANQLTDADRAVLAAAEQVARVNGWRLDPKTPGYELTELGVLVQAVRARRETQP